MSIELALALHRIGRPKILVVGDSIIDREVHCESVRFAQEAPHCPVWKEGWTTERAGGAAAVGAMVAALGAELEFAINMPDASAVKTRYFIGDTQVLRIDRDAHPFDASLTADYITEELIGWADCVLIADYGKGVCTDAVLRAAINGANKRGIPCIVDPHTNRAWKRFEGATAIKCNQHQWADAVPTGTWPWKGKMVVTVGPKGMCFSDNGRMTSDCVDVESRPRKQICVVGCGDAVLAALGVCVAGGMSWPDACQIANAAAGLKCERRGAVPVPRHEVVADMLDGVKVIPQELLPAISRGQHGCLLYSLPARLPETQHGTAVDGSIPSLVTHKTVWVNGCFDGLHPGHLHLLAEARKHGEVLIVGVNSNESVRYRKGPGRPLYADRCALLAALSCVDYVVEFGTQAELAACIEAVKPDVLAVGSDWRGRTIVGSEFAGRLHFVERLPDHSTTSTIDRIRTMPAG